MRPLSTHPLLCVYAKCGDILHTTSFNTLMGLSCYVRGTRFHGDFTGFNALMGLSCYARASQPSCITFPFQCPHGLELLRFAVLSLPYLMSVSMPSWAWVVTARMSNILNFSWYFLCIPAIYKCILAYLSIFFNQLSKFLRCGSPSTFLWTCLSHHSFIIFLVTNTNTLLSGLYLISTEDIYALAEESVALIPYSRAYTSFLRKLADLENDAIGFFLIPYSRAYTSFLRWSSILR